MMNTHKCFKQGQKLSAIWWPTGGETEVGKNGCLEIIIVFEYGQMAGVPWAEATFNDGRIQKYNLATVEGVKLLETTYDRIPK